MCEGGSKLNCREITDILQRVMITNALRLTPTNVKGFSFLAKLGMHMTSYSNDTSEEGDTMDKYPKLTRNTDLHPKDSTFDKNQKKHKRKISIRDVENRFSAVSYDNEPDGNVRKFHKKF